VAAQIWQHSMLTACQGASVQFAACSQWGSLAGMCLIFSLWGRTIPRLTWRRCGVGQLRAAGRHVVVLDDGGHVLVPAVGRQARVGLQSHQAHHRAVKVFQLQVPSYGVSAHTTTAIILCTGLGCTREGKLAADPEKTCQLQLKLDRPRPLTTVRVSFSSRTSSAGTAPLASVALVTFVWVEVVHRYDRSSSCWKAKANAWLPTCGGRQAQSDFTSTWLKTSVLLVSAAEASLADGGLA
jgi:hypothetical protein